MSIYEENPLGLLKSDFVFDSKQSNVYIVFQRLCIFGVCNHLFGAVKIKLFSI